MSLYKKNNLDSIDLIIEIASKLGNLLNERQLTISTAESCTGGLVSGAITEVAGSSKWFLQGWVTYSNQAKINELQVENELIIKYGAVSEQVAQAMAQGALLSSGSDVAIATTGIAGPDGGTHNKPVGTVWIAIAIKNQTTISRLLSLSGSRAEIREQAVIEVLQDVINVLNNFK